MIYKFLITEAYFQCIRKFAQNFYRGFRSYRKIKKMPTRYLISIAAWNQLFIINLVNLIIFHCKSPVFSRKHPQILSEVISIDKSMKINNP